MPNVWVFLNCDLALLTAPLSLVCMSVSKCAHVWVFFVFSLHAVIHYSVSSFPWCLTATGTLCLEKMTSSFRRQYYFIPLFPSDCLSLLWSLSLTVMVYCIDRLYLYQYLPLCLSTFLDHLCSSLFSITNFFSSCCFSLFPSPARSGLSVIKILCLCLSVSNATVTCLLDKGWSS